MLTYFLCELLCNVLLGQCKICLAFSCRRVGLVYDHKSDQHAPRPHTVSQAEHLVQRSTHRRAHYGVPGYADSEGNHDGEDGECGSKENDGGGLRERYKGGFESRSPSWRLSQFGKVDQTDALRRFGPPSQARKSSLQFSMSSTHH